MTEVAAANAQAKFPFTRTCEEIITPTAENRWVNYPYTKWMVALMDVDMAGAIVLATHAKADARQIPPTGGCTSRVGATPPIRSIWPSTRVTPGLWGHAEAGATAWMQGIGADDIAHFDLYSCFTSAINLSRDALGIARDDDRPVTVTGGLPYFGGPASNYMTHSIAGMAWKCCAAFWRRMCLVSGVGMFMTKHAYGLY